MNNLFPHELAWGDVYFSPWILVLAMSFFFTLVSVMILNRLRLSRFIYVPSYIFLAIMVIYIIIIDKFFIRF
jgi:hypothetical protein